MTRSTAGLLAGALSAVCLLVLPAASPGQSLVDRLVRDVTSTVESIPDVVRAPGRQPQRAGSGAGTRTATPGSPGGYQPPLHGTNPHGQGTVAAVDLGTTAQRPLAGDPSGAGDQPQNREEIVVGRTRGEKDANGYHGHITIVSLFGNELLGVDTRPGQTGAGPVESVQTALDAICTGTMVCLTALKADSTTTSNSSTNSFAVATASVGGPGGISAGVAESSGSISEDQNCQTSRGSSRLVGAGVGTAQAAEVGPSSSETRACNDGTRTQQNNSRVLGLLGAGVPLPASGCENGTPNVVTGLAFLAPIVCNANDAAGQASDTYGVREALSVFLLDSGQDTALVRTAAAGAESLAVAPPPVAPPPPVTPPAPVDPADRDRRDPDDRPREGDDGDVPNRGVPVAARPGAGPPECSDRLDNDGDGKVDFPNDPGCSSPSDDSEADAALAFTGANLLLTLLLGLLTLAAGLRLREAMVGRTH